MAARPRYDDARAQVSVLTIVPCVLIMMSLALLMLSLISGVESDGLLGAVTPRSSAAIGVAFLVARALFRLLRPPR
jgi:hypothetical protein